MRSLVISSIVLAFAATCLAASGAGAQPQARRGPEAWSGCCGLKRWPPAAPMRQHESAGGPLFRGYARIATGSELRHRLALSGSIPAGYVNQPNPLLPTPANAQRGAAVYKTQCASCHGVTGLGDGPGSKGLKPPPAELGWITNIPMSRWDSFMHWSIAEGGAAYQTAMPSYKGKLSDEEIWSVIGYIQARLPKGRAGTR